MLRQCCRKVLSLPRSITLQPYGITGKPHNMTKPIKQVIVTTERKRKKKVVWHTLDEKADSSKYVVLYDVDGGYMSPPSRCILGFDSMFIDVMNKKYGANYTMWAYKDDLAPNKENCNIYTNS